MEEYNISSMQNGPVEAITAVNTMSNGIFGILLLFGFGIIIYMILTRFTDSKNASFASLMSMMGGSWLLLGMGMINTIVFSILLIILLITLIAIIKTDGR